ncbi:MAG: tRNA lysidine(34) synthetase TilS [Francisellaceae bacterium]
MSQRSMNLVKYQRWFKKYEPEYIYVAYSGGVDSTVLLHHLANCVEPHKLIALHVNHGLSSNANNWHRYCLEFAEWLGVGFQSIELTPPKPHKNIEAWARSQRYAFFESVLSNRPNCILMTAHHQKDQAETFLLQAIRGAGITGLSGISADQPFALGRLVRPFLALSKQDILAYAEQNRLSWVEDESNNSSDYDRNFIRHEILPRLNCLRDGVEINLAKASRHCHEADVLLNNYLAEDLLPMMNHDGALDLERLKSQPELKKKHLLRYWLSDRFDLKPNARQLNQITAAVAAMQTGWQYRLGNKMLKAVYGFLFLTDSIKPDDSRNQDHNEVVLIWLEQQGIPLSKLDRKALSIRKRTSTDRCRYPGRDKSQKLKVLFQELKIPADRRQAVKIIEQNGKIIAVYPFFICQ